MGRTKNSDRGGKAMLKVGGGGGLRGGFVGLFGGVVPRRLFVGGGGVLFGGQDKQPSSTKSVYT